MTTLNDVWEFEDYAAGLCPLDLVGKSKQITPKMDTADEPPFVPSDAVLEVAKVRGIPLDDGDAIFGLAFELDPPGVMKRNPTLYIDWNRQKRLEREGNAAQAAKLADMTATKLKALSTQEILTKIMAGIFAEPEEIRDRILQRMGIDLDGLRELIEEGSAG